jgi:uncharacterized membrane protein
MQTVNKPKIQNPFLSHTNFPKWVVQWWWVIAFFILVLAIYLSSLKQQQETIQEALTELQQLTQKKNKLYAQKEELLLQMENQTNPAWIEIVLKRNLGLVPKNQVKVYFYNKK